MEAELMVVQRLRTEAAPQVMGADRMADQLLLTAGADQRRLMGEAAIPADLAAGAEGTRHPAAVEVEAIAAEVEAIAAVDVTRSNG
jgi:hypothetical protein